METLIQKLKTENLMRYQSIPFWSWNGDLQPDELKRQIHWMCERGMGGFFMHARSGLKTEYLSEEWMDCIGACAQEAEKLGMDAWIYDENGWPSGFAGGKLLENPENCDRYILAETGAYDANATVSYRLSEEQLIRVQDGSAECEYLNLYIHTANSTADILNPEVVDQFIELTHEAYKAQFGEDFAKKIKGFFTDEPQYHRWNTPYTNVMARYYKENYGEDILDGLGLLFVEKEGYRAFRYRYWKTMQHLMLENFARKVYDWCDGNGVKLTGHYIEEDGLAGQMLCCGGIMPFYEYEHIPGIDWLGKESDHSLAPKQVSSVAKQLGKKQVLTETFAICGWDIRPMDLRRIAGFQYVNGVNLMCQHLLPYTECGTRKYDYPAHYSSINPWVQEEFKAFNDYFTRLGYLLANSVEEVRVAVLHPIRSAYFDYKRCEFDTSLASMDETLHNTCKRLAGAGVAYHFLDETLLAKYGFVEGLRIGCGQCDYDYLILPDLLTMDKTTEVLLRQYVENGGKVLVLGENPTYLEGEEYAYAYLKSNCTWNDVLAVRSFVVADENTDIYVTHRVADGVPFLFVQNASADETQSQTFVFAEEYNSFVKLDLNTYETQRIPMTITLTPGESMLLFPEKGEVSVQKEFTYHTVKFDRANVNFEENYLPLEHVRYSADGVSYSEPIFCRELFHKLLEDRYDGKIYLQYEFDVREIPKKLLLRVEECNAAKMMINGMELTEKLPSGIEKAVIAYDIASLVKEGINTYTIEMNWHQPQEVYYALFGENVSESLRNCLVYESELEPAYLAGEFGVYPVTEYREKEDARFVCADGYYIGKVPVWVSEPVTEGFPFLRGAITMTQEMTFEENNVVLQLKGSYQTAEVWVNGQWAGKLLFDRELNISKYTKAGKNEIKVRFLISNRNLMGGYTAPRDKEESHARSLLKCF